MEIINYTESSMRTLFSVLILSFLIAGCASVETTTQGENEAVAAGQDTMIPKWYNPLETSQSDSAAVYGFALATATDSSEAVSLAKNSAMINLRYEIDFLAERTRKLLIENEKSEPYSSPLYIIDLRNTISDLPLSSSYIDVAAFQTENNIYYAYVMTSLPKSNLWETMSGRLNDSDFMEVFKEYDTE